MQNREIRTRIDYQYPNEHIKVESFDVDRTVAKYKEKMKEQRENKQKQRNILIFGDYVLVKQPKRNKWSTEFKPLFYVVIDVEGSKITARRVTDGRTVVRDDSHFRIVNNSADDVGNEQPNLEDSRRYH